ncbi:MAG: FAD-dependent oxidoreductase [Mollicutes bacterium]|nr:FAD-dependent oxidoreductase [Mollicutes bacterium]
MYDIIIIGAGPSGMSAALYALRANKKVLLLEKKCYGGQIINASNIENYPALPNVSGYDFATNLYNQIKSLGVILKYEEVLEVTDKKEVITTKDTYKGKNIIIATGLKKRKLNLENEDKLLGSGISYCATCDGNFYKNKNVAVVGGGNTALEDALYLSNIASKVYLIHRRDNFRGEKKLISEVKEKNNIELILNSNITKIIGEDNLNSIEITDNRNNISKLEIDGLFIAIGNIPDNNRFKNIIDLDENGYIIANANLKTKADNIYVAGDTRVKTLRQLVTATSDGAIAVTEITKEMEN